MMWFRNGATPSEEYRMSLNIPSSFWVNWKPLFRVSNGSNAWRPTHISTLNFATMPRSASSEALRP